MSQTRASVDRLLELTSFMGDRLRLSWQTKRRRVLLCALAFLPVLAVLLTTAVSAVLLIGPGGRVTNWYVQNATVALMNREYDKARLCYCGLLQREPDNQQYQFGLALSLFGLGDNSAAMILTRRLAPEGAYGYAPAHVFVAEQLITAPQASSDDLRSAESHLLRALQSDPNDRKTNALIAAVYARTDRWDQLKRHLPLAGKAVDEIGVMAAEYSLSQGDAAEAEAWAGRAAEFYRNRCLADPKDYQSRLKWAQASAMLRDFQTALDTLEVGIRDSGDPAFRQSAVQVCVAWSTGAVLTPARRIAVLHRGLSLDPQNPALLMQLTDPAIAEGARYAPAATQSSEGTALQAICNAIGASRSDNAQEVLSNLTSALAIGDGQTPAMIANVACLWAYSDRPDARSALGLTSGLVELLPNSPIAQRACGLVLARQGRWNKASTYLHDVLKLVPNDIAVRSQLAACYQNMGMPEEAAEQRRILSAATRPATSPVK